MKKIAICILLFCCIQANAQALIPLYMNIFNGFYFGAGAGINQTMVDYTFDDLISSKNPSTHTHDITNIDFGETNFFGQLLIGYGENFYRNYYLGLELLYKYLPTDISTSGSSTTYYDKNGSSQLSVQDIYNSVLSNDHSFLGTLHLGLVAMPNLLIYSVLGIEYAQFTDTIDASGQILNGKGGYDQPPPFRYVFHTSKIGFAPGIGIEFFICKNIALRTEYIYTFFGDITNINIANIQYQDENSINHKVTLTQNYKFSNLSRGLYSFQLVWNFMN